MSDILQTEFELQLPMGYVDENGTRHCKGTMRLATAGDEILPMKDPRVQSNPAYLTIILLARVVTRLGTMNNINTHVIENMFSQDFEYLQDFYNRINKNGKTAIDATCPKCQHKFSLEPPGLGEL